MKRNVSKEEKERMRGKKINKRNTLGDLYEDKLPQNIIQAKVSSQKRAASSKRIILGLKGLLSPCTSGRKHLF